MGVMSFFQKKTTTPKHMAFTCDGGFDESSVFLVISEMVRLNIPVVTLYLMPSDKKAQTYEAIDSVLKRMSRSKIINTNKVRVSVLGKWYDLPGFFVETIKSVIRETKGYDSFFLNLCINYSGQDEIVDSCKILSKRAAAGLLDAHDITRDMIKDNLYSSYYLPPDLLVRDNRQQSMTDLLLWDMRSAYYHFLGKPFRKLEKSDIRKAIEKYSS